MDLNFPVFATGVRILRASNDVGPLFLGPESTRILEINIHLFISSIRVDPGPRNRGPTSLLALKNMCKHGEIKVHWSSACGLTA